MVSQYEVYCFSEIPLATAAFQSLAPSIWTASPRARAAAASSASVAGGQLLPAPPLWVFSTQTSFAGG